jgi:carbonic anhydrase
MIGSKQESAALTRDYSDVAEPEVARPKSHKPRSEIWHCICGVPVGKPTRGLTMSNVDELVKANAAYAANFDQGSLPMPPGKHVAIITCMDARVVPAKALGINEGDVHVIRNAGGRPHDALRSLVISQRLLGTNEVMVIHHTDCGMLSFVNQDLHAKIKEDLGVEDHDDYLPFSDVEQSVRDDVSWLRSSPLVPDDVPVRGFVFDVKTGRITEVA